MIQRLLCGGLYTVKQTKLDRMVEDIKALGLDKTPVYYYSTDFTKRHLLTVHDDKRGEDVVIGTIKDFWLPELFSSAPELALEVQRLREIVKVVEDAVKTHIAWQAGASEASVLWDELAWELHDMLYGGEEE